MSLFSWLFRKPSVHPVWTEFRWASVADYRGFTLIVQVAGDDTSFVWKALRKDNSNLEVLFEVDASSTRSSSEMSMANALHRKPISHALSREAAKLDAEREIDWFIAKRKHGSMEWVNQGVG